MHHAPAFHSIQASALDIPFRRPFARRTSTQAVWVRIRSADGNTGFGEGCLREHETGETLQDAQAFVAARAEWWQRRIGNFEDLAGWVRAYGIEIDANPAAWTAVELALLDLFGRRIGRPVETVLGLPHLEGVFRYTAVLDGVTAAEVARAREAGFRDFRVTLTGEREHDEAVIDALRAAAVPPRRVRVGAQHLWNDANAAIDYLGALDFSFFALEEPLAARDFAGMARVARELDTRMVLDESVARADQMVALPGDPERWLINVRVSKMGGLLRSLDFVREARGRGLRVIVGACPGETSILARAALIVAGAAGEALVAQEGGLGTHLLEHDVAEPSLRYGPGGALDTGTCGVARSPGLGLAIS